MGTRNVTAGRWRLPLVGRLLAYLWAAPYTLAGLGLGLPVLLLGGHVRLRAGALEFGGGRLGAAASRLPRRIRFGAITFGHVILGVDATTLAAVRAHEQVHVRQYERWGLLFGPAYLLSSVAQWLSGRHPYLDNRFEREAYTKQSAARRELDRC